MARPDYILAALASFVGLWGLSLLLRGWRGRPRDGTCCCPSCRGGMSEAHGLACPSCRYEAAAPAELFRRVRNRPMIGAGLAVTAASPVIFWCAAYVHAWMSLDDLGDGWGLWNAASLGVVAFGAAVVGVGYRGDRARGRRRCPKCWYDMSGATGLRCPECGHMASHARHLYKPRRRRRAIQAGAVIALTAAIPYHYPRVRDGGWMAAVPSTVMIAGFRWLPDEFIVGSNSAWWAEEWTLLGRANDGRLWGWQRALLLRQCRAISRSDDPRTLMRVTLVAVGSGDWQNGPPPAVAAWFVPMAARITRLYLDAPSPAPVALSRAAAWCSTHHPHTFSAGDYASLAAHLASWSPDDVAAACMLFDSAQRRPGPQRACPPETVVEALLDALDHPNRIVAVRGRQSLLACLSRCPQVAEGLRQRVLTGMWPRGSLAAAILAGTFDDFPEHEAFLRMQLVSGSDSAAALAFWGLEAKSYKRHGEWMGTDDSIVDEAIGQLEGRTESLEPYFAALRARPDAAAAPARIDALLVLLESANVETAVGTAGLLSFLATHDRSLVARAGPAMRRLLDRLSADASAPPTAAPRVSAAIAALKRAK